MTALATRKLSPLARRELTSHRRALSAPMTRIPMAGDPYMPRVDNRDADDAFTMRAGAAAIERRACQYAAFIGARDGKLTQPMRQYNAIFDGATVHFDAYDAAGELRTIAVDIPPHVLAFDPTLPALALPAPEADSIPAPRCEHTAPLALDAPAPQAPEAAPASLAPRQPKLAKAATRPRKAAQSAMREWAESRAMRAARIAKLPETTRRAIGARP